MSNKTDEHLKVVIVGHVDHGKSTILGRLLADTNSLPEGKLDQVRDNCRRNSKPFEYAFLLDALKAEQSQGITIDAARCFFNTDKRNYIVIDAPGHIEFLKNMVTGAARADAALLVIDAKEGVQENSRRHGYMLSMLGVRQIAVVINKFDLVDYDKNVFDNIVKEYNEFLDNLGLEATNYIPASGREGDNIAIKSTAVPWYKGPTVVEQMDLFLRPEEDREKPFRMPVQDIYKFTAGGDDRRIVAGTIEAGYLNVGDEVVFQPSGKESTVASIEGFNLPPADSIAAPNATGFTLTTQIYARAGEIMCRKSDPQPIVATRFRVSLFWLGRKPMVKGRQYKLKLASARVPVQLVEINNVLDASELSSVGNSEQINRHDIGECVFETSKPIAFDFVTDHHGTGRFVIVDDYEIAGGGIVISTDEEAGSVLEQQISDREYKWESGHISNSERIARNHHRGKFLVVTGQNDLRAKELAKAIERRLFSLRMSTYYLGVGNILDLLDSEQDNKLFSREQHIRHLGELARIMTDAGLIFVTSLTEVDDYDLEKLKLLNTPNEFLVINTGDNLFANYQIDLEIDNEISLDNGVDLVLQLLSGYNIIPDYCI